MVTDRNRVGYLGLGLELVRVGPMVTVRVRVSILEFLFAEKFAGPLQIHSKQLLLTDRQRRHRHLVEWLNT